MTSDSSHNPKGLPDKDFDSLDPLLQSIHESMLIGLGQLAVYLGHNRLMGELYAALFLSPAPLSLDELTELVGKSKASVSMNTRILEHLGGAGEVWMMEGNPTNRKFYKTEGDIVALLIRRLETEELPRINTLLNQFQENASNLKNLADSAEHEHRELASHYIRRLEQIIEIFIFAKQLILSILEQTRNRDLSGIKQIELK